MTTEEYLALTFEDWVKIFKEDFKKAYPKESAFTEADLIVINIFAQKMFDTVQDLGEELRLRYEEKNEKI